VGIVITAAILRSGYLVNPNATYQINIIALISGKCLEVNQVSGGKNIIQQSRCTGGDNQAWVIPGPLPTTVTKTTIQSPFSKKCLAVSGSQAQDGDVIDQKNCGNIGNQIWVLNPIGGPTPPHDSGKGQLCDSCNPAAPTCQANAKCIILLLTGR